MRDSKLLSILKQKDGATAIEFAFLIPIVLVLFCTSVVVFLLFQSSKTSERATYTVGDIISRRTTVDNAFLDSTYQMFLRITNRAAADVTYRISSVKKDNNTFTVSWSYPVAPQVALTTAGIPTSRMPLITDGDSILIIEASVKPPSISSFLPITVSDYANIEFVRPRFTAAIAKSN